MTTDATASPELEHHVRALLLAQQRVGELEAKLSQRDAVIRGLRNRLHELEQPYWERQSRLSEELLNARNRVVEFEQHLIHDRDAHVAEQTAAAQQELSALMATKTFRYTSVARRAYGVARHMYGRRSSTS